MITLTKEDLLAVIGPDELDGLTESAQQIGQVAPVDASITEALGVIKMFVDPFKLNDDSLRRIWRILAVCWIYNRVGTMPDKRKREEDQVLAWLRDIRDGKFDHLLVDETVETGDGGGTFGSAAPITGMNVGFTGTA